MCAINGTTQHSPTLVAQMNAATHHRGPDGTRVLELPGVTLGFNRLAIIDLNPRAMQPLVSASGRYALVFNGELYNYRELKSELAGYPFVTEGDVEVVLAAYERWGSACLKRFNGMFAFALWDTVERSLTLVRDPVGIKPLYYAVHNHELFFSSEMCGLVAAGVSRTVDRESVAHYLRFLYVPKERTMYSAIKKLLPGTILTFTRGEIVMSQYASEFRAETPDSYQEATDIVRGVVQKAVMRQLVSDRPVGVYLSGGIDSSVVVSCAAAVHPSINTYSVGFELEPHEDPGKFNADADLALKTAEHFKTTHHDFRLSVSGVAELFPDMIRGLDAPIGNATTIAQYFLASKTKPTATVVLSGEGGDELFGGYERYRLALLASWVPKFLASRKVGLRGVERYLQLMTIKDSVLKPLLTEELQDVRPLFSDAFTQDVPIVHALMRADERNWLVDEALLRADLMSMAHAVEQRVPLIDLEVRAVAHALPRSYKVTPFVTKRILKDAFASVLPTDVLAQPKRGWFSPGAKWLRRPDFAALTETVFADGYTELSQLFNLSRVRELELAHRERRAYHYTELWALLVLLAWAREHHVTL